MRHFIRFSVLCILLSGIFLSQGVISQDDLNFPITIKAAKNRWISFVNSVPVNYAGNVFPASAMSITEVTITKNDYAGKKVNVVTELDIWDENKNELSTYSVTSEQVVDQSPGAIYAAFNIQGMNLIGVGIMRIYIKGKGKQIISNMITLPAAGGKEAEKELEGKYGPKLIE